MRFPRVHRQISRVVGALPNAKDCDVVQALSGARRADTLLAICASNGILDVLAIAANNAQLQGNICFVTILQIICETACVLPAIMLIQKPPSKPTVERTTSTISGTVILALFNLARTQGNLINVCATV